MGLSHSGRAIRTTVWDVPGGGWLVIASLLTGDWCGNEPSQQSFDGLVIALQLRPLLCNGTCHFLFSTP